MKINIIESHSLKYWIDYAKVNEELAVQIQSAEIVLLPECFRDAPIVFSAGTADLFAQLKELTKLNCEICISDGDYQEIELNSSVIRLGHFFCKDDIKGFVIGVLASIVANQCTTTEPQINIENNVQVTTILGMPTYDQSSTCTFKLTTYDDVSGELKTVEYEGPVDGITEVNKVLDKH